MRRTLLPWFVLLGTNVLSAQDPPAAVDPLIAGKQRLTVALQKTAALNDVAFTATWGPDSKEDGDVRAFVMSQGSSAKGKVTGSWHESLQHVAFEGGGRGDQLCRANSVTIARDDDRDWCVRKSHFADGNQVTFPADVASMLRQLATMDLAVVQRAPGEIDQRPVELVTVALNPDQVTELARGEHVPDALVSAMAGFMMAFGGGAAQQRPEAPRPSATVDLAIAFDPGTSLVQELRFRSWLKDDGNGRNFVIRGGGAGAVRVLGGNADKDEEEEGDEKAKGDAAAPMTYENGLPVRPRKKTTVMDFAVRLSEHGTKKPPELGDAAKKLLGR